MTSLSSSSHVDIVARLSKKIDDVLQPIVPSGKPCALVGFPNYPNVGDSAIWLGTRGYLDRHGAPVVYACDTTTYSQEQLRAQLKNGVILLQGGGNLGDLWPDHQRLREAVIEAFPDKKIVQLPQTIHFKETTSLARARAVFDRHPDLTILARDQRSLEFARNEFRAKTFLCPDMAFALGSLQRPQSPRSQIVWLARTDIEAIGRYLRIPSGEVEQIDWLEDRPSVTLCANEFLTRQICHHPRALRRLSGPLSRTYDPLARERLMRGRRMLSMGQVVITDRLHGHILCLLLGIPHVLLDNNYGKISRFFETWTRDSELVVWADSPEQALEKSGEIEQGLRQPLKSRAVRREPVGDIRQAIEDGRN
ncbi:MAG: polysaccharide pyruvyl transferase family protein [Nitrospiraceae bacterium]